MSRRHPGGCRVAPFGHPRIKDRMRLPVAFRSLPRPSSPAAAKASAMRPYSLGAKFRRQAAQGTVRIRSHVLDSGHLAHLCLVSPVHVVLWKSVSFPRMPADVGGGHAASCQRVCRILEIRPGKIRWRKPIGRRWWSRRDSNPRHPACKAGALPTELRPQRGMGK